MSSYYYLHNRNVAGTPTPVRSLLPDIATTRFVSNPDVAPPLSQSRSLAPVASAKPACLYSSVVALSSPLSSEEKSVSHQESPGDSKEYISYHSEPENRSQDFKDFESFSDKEGHSSEWFTVMSKKAHKAKAALDWHQCENTPLGLEKVQAINKAQESLTDKELNLIKKRFVSIGGNLDVNQPEMEQDDKEKGPDPRNWGALEIPIEELDYFA